MHHGSAHSGRPISDASSSVWWRATLPETPEQLEPLNPAPCPITLAWSAEDRIFPPAINGRIARQRIPDARFITLPDVARSGGRKPIPRSGSRSHPADRGCFAAVAVLDPDACFDRAEDQSGHLARWPWKFECGHDANRQSP